jgi:AcrR family transcriptional regulator
VATTRTTTLTTTRTSAGTTAHPSGAMMCDVVRSDDDAGAVDADPPRRGRPRSAEAAAAILSATLELAGEVGIAGMSMDEVAHRAGVSKATIYRRWTSKESLVLDALRTAMQPLDDVDTGSLRGDLIANLTELGHRMGAGRLNDVLPHLIEVSCHDEALRTSLDDYVRHRRVPLRTILERGVARGELAPTTDIELLLDLLIAPFVYRRLLSRASLDAGFVRRLLDAVLGDVPGAPDGIPAP